MIKGVSIGNYFPGDSVIHKLDPRSKLLFTFIIIITLFMIKSYWALIWITVFYIFAVQLAKLSFRYIFRGLKPIFFFIFFTLIIHFFFTPGEPLIYFGPLKITAEGLERGIFMACRLILLIGISVLLTATTSPLRLTDGLQSLFSPLKRLKVPTGELALMVSIALRFIPTFIKETDKIIKAQSSRGVDFSSGSIKERLENIIPILIPLFISSFQRAEDLATAMEARCYKGEEGRTRLHPLKYRKRDFVGAMVMLIYVGILLVI